MLASLREELIIKELHEKGIVNINEISEMLGASLATIRRDLTKLENENKLTRIHGGAKSNYSLELTMSEKLILNYNDKKAVCKSASDVIKDGDCIFIDGGSTLEPMYEYIKDKAITVVTNNALILAKIKNSKAKFIMVGGDYLPHYNMVVGTFAINQIGNYSYDHCFIGCTGINLETGLAYTVEQETKDIKITAMKNSNNNYLLIDSSKINVKAFIKIAELNAFTKIFVNKVKIAEDLDNLILV